MIVFTILQPYLNSSSYEISTWQAIPSLVKECSDSGGGGKRNLFLFLVHTPQMVRVYSDSMIRIACSYSAYTELLYIGGYNARSVVNDEQSLLISEKHSMWLNGTLSSDIESANFVRLRDRPHSSHL